MEYRIRQIESKDNKQVEKEHIKFFEDMIKCSKNPT